MASSSSDYTSEEVSTTTIQRFLGLLRRLEKLEKETEKNVLYEPGLCPHSSFL